MRTHSVPESPSASFSSQSPSVSITLPQQKPLPSPVLPLHVTQSPISYSSGISSLTLSQSASQQHDGPSRGTSQEGVVPDRHSFNGHQEVTITIPPAHAISELTIPTPFTAFETDFETPSFSTCVYATFCVRCTTLRCVVKDGNITDTNPRTQRAKRTEPLPLPRTSKSDPKRTQSKHLHHFTPIPILLALTLAFRGPRAGHRSPHLSRGFPTLFAWIADVGDTHALHHGLFLCLFEAPLTSTHICRYVNPTALEVQVGTFSLQLAADKHPRRRSPAHDFRPGAYPIETAHNDLDAAHQESPELHNNIEDLQNETEALKSDLEALENKLLNMEEEWSVGENQRAHLESELLRTTEEHETHITSLTAELTFAHENISRLETNIKERDDSISNLTTTLLSHRDEAESLREELATLKVEHSRAFSSQTRTLQDLQAQEKDLRSQLEVALRERAESDIMLVNSKERVGSLMDDVARLRRTAHEMQQSSAAREVTIVQLRKERERDREDVNGLNIALDSKQQSLELIKRKISLKTVSTPTPVPSRPMRRESMVGTPSSSSRPPSSMSDTSKDGKSDTPSLAPRASLSALSRSARINANAPGKMGPPAPKPRSFLATPTPLTRASLTSSTSRAPSSLGKSGATPRPSGLGLGMTTQRVSTSSVESNLKTPIGTGARRVSVSSSVPSELDEKENVSAAGLKKPRRAVPAWTRCAPTP
ncbi:hypothetical protein DEU56DRAFT_934066 [Suillus clintonianus]|uniref:uncharacterized protein n=1 Tax=Suillus clintonianus TaxID=1904413 RepID=UPI001B88627B|nr:uncharacterized protein DEU56DRAFT_934066 [Suillus clintonianus]KAG2113690.1 hypothetical protein DEU56DRAFT_934066 [Suillus clintonianus]